VRVTVGAAGLQDLVFAAVNLLFQLVFGCHWSVVGKEKGPIAGARGVDQTAMQELTLQ
jgi:hypothetical protein